MLASSSTMHTSYGTAPGVIPRLHKALSDPEERFNLYDAPSRRNVERSAITAAAIRGFPEAFNRKSFLLDAHGLPAGFGGRRNARATYPPTPALRRIIHPDQPAEPAEAPKATPSPFRALVGLGPADARHAPPTPARKDEYADSFFNSSGGAASDEGKKIGPSDEHWDDAPTSADDHSAAREAALDRDIRIQAARTLTEFLSRFPRMRQHLYPDDEDAPTDACRTFPLSTVIAVSEIVASQWYGLHLTMNTAAVLKGDYLPVSALLGTTLGTYSAFDATSARKLGDGTLSTSASSPST